MTTEAKPQTEALLKQASRRRAILALLRIDEASYAKIVYDQGLRYLDAYLPSDYDVSIMERTAIFWQWWKNHWNIRDEKFLLGLWRHRPTNEIRTLYAQFNSGSMLAHNIHPNSVVLRDSYEMMTSELIQAETAKP